MLRVKALSDKKSDSLRSKYLGSIYAEVISKLIINTH
jgi:hypothetical protein